MQPSGRGEGGGRTRGRGCGSGPSRGDAGRGRSVKRGKEVASKDDLFQMCLDCETSPWFDKTIAEIATDVEDPKHQVWHGMSFDDVAKLCA